MFRSTFLAIVCLVLIASASAQIADGKELSVTVFNDAGVPSRVVDEAEKITARIYLDIGIRLIWKDRNAPISGGKQLFIRIGPHALNLPGDDFGIAFVGTDGRGVQGDVFYSGIASLSRDSSLGPAEVMGHVMAHELGHLLLGLNSHSRLGIMQAHWSQAQLRKMSMGFLRFEKNQAEAITARLLDRETMLTKDN